MRHLAAIAFATLCAAGALAAEPRVASPFPAANLRPFWIADTMQGESVLFVREEDAAQPAASLLFEPTCVLAVTSASGEVAYEEGRDYVWTPGSHRILLPAGSRIVSRAPSELRRPAGSQPYHLTHRDGNGEIMFGATHEYHDLQTIVTYTHRSQWSGPRPSLARDALPRTIEKLSVRLPVTIALMGDSISCGCNASGWAGVPPFQPPYQDLLAQGIEARYGGKVTLHNVTDIGTDTAWGLASVRRAIDADPDLVIIAFGMNDAASRPADEYRANVRAIIDAVRQARPDAEFILVATMLAEPNWTSLQHERFPQYRDALSELRGPGIALADLTSVWETLLKEKRYWDLTGNGVNHPNDFGHRLYAQVLMSLLVPPAD